MQILILIIKIDFAKEENLILSKYKKFLDELKKGNENYDKVRIIFYVNPQ